MIARQIAKLIAPLRRRVALMVGRCVITVVHNEKALQELQVQALEEIYDAVSHYQHYGFTSVAHQGAEAILLALGGNRNASIVVAVEDKRYRLQGLEGGEVALYDDLGQKIHLSRKGIIIETQEENGVTVQAKKVLIQSDKATIKSKEITLQADEIMLDASTIQATGNLEVKGDLIAKGNVALGEGMFPVARVGDDVTTPTGLGKITTGSNKVKG